MDPHRISKIAQRRRWRRWEGEWLFTAEQADEIRRTIRAYDEHVPVAAWTCTVEGCETPAKVRGMCNAHYRRVSRHGSTERRDGSDWQRSKTHCPNNHEYTPENTYRFADGRRRCRACRLERASQQGAREEARGDDAVKNSPELGAVRQAGRAEARPGPV
ncbi:hypothetical protein [Luteimicrobium xylanilyticum]|uniref:hypothetical protein n=1 Tax=Luteimicrobium xylanilyticum TaxID=1133546 RepID=UPI00128FD204|nr:hypothetical protein [Luteimicrobium xylanilyticum]